MRGIILYGPPAAGKDTITDSLHQLDARCDLFPRLKAGPGKMHGYRMTTTSAIDALRTKNELVWENRRYGSLYAIDRPTLTEHLAEHISILHLGQVEAIDAVIEATPDSHWFIVYLWCPRAIAAKRIVARGSRDIDERLKAWDETEPVEHASMFINTAEVTADEAAEEIHRRLTQLG